jgi:hypothetical protein
VAREKGLEGEGRAEKPVLFSVEVRFELADGLEELRQLVALARCPPTLPWIRGRL